MIINKSGVTIRVGVDTLREMGRATQGVKIIRLKGEDVIASVAKVSRFDEGDDLNSDQVGEGQSELEDNISQDNDINITDNNNETENNDNENI